METDQFIGQQATYIGTRADLNELKVALASGAYVHDPYAPPNNNIYTTLAAGLAPLLAKNGRDPISAQRLREMHNGPTFTLKKAAIAMQISQEEGYAGQPLRTDIERWLAGSITAIETLRALLLRAVHPSQSVKLGVVQQQRTANGIVFSVRTFACGWIGASFGIAWVSRGVVGRGNVVTENVSSPSLATNDTTAHTAQLSSQAQHILQGSQTVQSPVQRNPLTLQASSLFPPSQRQQPKRRRDDDEDDDTFAPTSKRAQSESRRAQLGSGDEEQAEDGNGETNDHPTTMAQYASSTPFAATPSLPSLPSAPRPAPAALPLLPLLPASAAPLVPHQGPDAAAAAAILQNEPNNLHLNNILVVALEYDNSEILRFVNGQNAANGAQAQTIAMIPKRVARAIEALANATGLPSDLMRRHYDTLRKARGVNCNNLHKVSTDEWTAHGPALNQAIQSLVLATGTSAIAAAAAGPQLPAAYPAPPPPSQALPASGANGLQAPIPNAAAPSPFLASYPPLTNNQPSFLPSNQPRNQQ